MHNCAILKIPFDISHLHLIFHNNTIARKGFTHIFLESQGIGRGFIRCYILRTGSCRLRHHAGRQKQQHEQHYWEEQSESSEHGSSHQRITAVRSIGLIGKMIHKNYFYLIIILIQAAKVLPVGEYDRESGASLPKFPY